jgi:hypothetical protein
MADEERFADPTEIRHTIGAQGNLTIHNISGSVELRATDGDEVLVVAHSESGGTDALPITVRRTEGGLHIEVEKKGSEGFGSWFRNRGGIEFDVSVPRGARVEINTVSADIQTRFLAGEQSYKTVSGDIAADPDGGRLRLATVSGDITVRAGEPCEVHATTTSGDVQVEGAEVTAFDVRTVSGDVELGAGLAVGPLHTVETVSGDLSVESPTGVTVNVKRGMDLARGGSGALVAGDGGAQLRFRTLSGDCHVEGARRSDKGQRGRRREHPLEGLGERIAREFAASPDLPPIPPLPSVPETPPRTPVDQLDVLRALERGEIDVDEAARRLQEA